MSHDALTNDRDFIIIPLVEITKLQYQNARKPKDDMVAETKFGFLIKMPAGLTAYIQYNNKCYRGPFFSDDALYFQDGSLGEFETRITAIINKPQPKPTKSTGAK